MSKEATLQVRMDAKLKAQAEDLYAELGTSLPEAVRIFAKQSVVEQGMPFRIHLIKKEKTSHQRIGVAKGKISVPHDFDKYDDEIGELFT